MRVSLDATTRIQSKWQYGKFAQWLQRFNAHNAINLLPNINAILWIAYMSEYVCMCVSNMLVTCLHTYVKHRVSRILCRWSKQFRWLQPLPSLRSTRFHSSKIFLIFPSVTFTHPIPRRNCILCSMHWSHSDIQYAYNGTWRILPNQRTNERFSIFYVDVCVCVYCELYHSSTHITYNAILIRLHTVVERDECFCWY